MARERNWLHKDFALILSVYKMIFILFASLQLVSLFSSIIKAFYCNWKWNCFFYSYLLALPHLISSSFICTTNLQYICSRVSSLQCECSALLKSKTFLSFITPAMILKKLCHTYLQMKKLFLFLFFSTLRSVPHWWQARKIMVKDT